MQTALPCEQHSHMAIGRHENISNVTFLQPQVEFAKRRKKDALVLHAQWLHLLRNPNDK